MLDFTKPPPSHTAICPLPRFQFPLRAFSLLSEHHKVSALLQAKQSSPRLKALAQRRQEFWSRSQFYYWHPEASAYSMAPFSSGAVLSPSRHWILGSLPAFRVSHIPPATVLLPHHPEQSRWRGERPGCLPPQLSVFLQKDLLSGGALLDFSYF